MDLHNFIIANWEKSVRDPKFNNKTYLPNKYTTPSVDGMFQNFYYWDAYFTNIGLLADDDIEMVRNNLNIMKYFVDEIGFVPNADHLTYGSQPPFFTRGVFDLYQKSKDVNDIKRYINELIIEMRFWEEKRMTDIGLNQYKCGFPLEYCTNNYSYFNDRVGGFNEEEKMDKVQIIKNCYAIAESGLDMNTRLSYKGNRFCSNKYIHLDLNSILYDAEIKISQMLKIINEDELSIEFFTKAESRKALMNKYFLTKEEIYRDYNFENDDYSSLLTLISLYPYAFGISDDKEGCLKIFNALKDKYGIHSSIKHEGILLQWEYGNMWPPHVYIAYQALINTNNVEEANWLRNTFINVLEKVYEKTSKLWEKYNPINGEIAYSKEYETPTMMGWSAGIYEYFYNIK